MSQGDYFWDLYCDLQERIKDLIPPGWEIADFWNDNDSCGLYLQAR
jgi:hypothetical protein